MDFTLTLCSSAFCFVDFGPISQWREASDFQFELTQRLQQCLQRALHLKNYICVVFFHCKLTCASAACSAALVSSPLCHILCLASYAES